MEKKIRLEYEVYTLPVVPFLVPVYPDQALQVALRKRSFRQGQTVYVPVYSHIYSGDREHPFYLAATLSIRNTDLKHTIRVLTVDYYDSKGKLLKSYLENPINLNPLSATRYIIKESDKSGGSGPISL
jgi:hypothetical protein